MIKHTLQKIDKLIKEKEHQLPEIMLKFVAFLQYYARKLEQKSSQYVALDLFSDALKLFRRYMVDEPFKLTKITAIQISKALAEDSCQFLSEIFELRNRFLKELAAFNPTDPFGKKVLSQMSELKWTNKLKEPLSDAQLLKKQIQQKKGNKSYLSQFATLLWYGQFKGQYLVHVDDFVQKLVPFCQQYFSLLDFMHQSSFPYLKELCDPDKKYFLTSFNCDQIFVKFRNPDVLDKLWELTQQKNKNQSFISQSSMVVRILVDDSDHIYGITGQKLLLPQGQEKDVKLSPAVVFGSSPESDITLKSKYISRKQMVIIEETKSDVMKSSQHNKHNFSIVCLSQTNFTVITYPHRVKAGVGLIFFGGDIKYQMMSCQKTQSQLDSINIDDDRTLSILPQQKGPKTFKVYIEKLTFLILSGQDKNKQFTFFTKNMFNQQDEYKHVTILKQVFEFDQQFYLKPGTKILCKTANEIVENRPSRKVRLRKDMNIFLQEYTIKIE